MGIQRAAASGSRSSLEGGLTTNTTRRGNPCPETVLFYLITSFFMATHHFTIPIPAAEAAPRVLGLDVFGKPLRVGARVLVQMPPYYNREAVVVEPRDGDFRRVRVEIQGEPGDSRLFAAIDLELIR